MTIIANSTKKLSGVPDGTYDGVWGGWDVEFTDPRLSGLCFRVDKGIRTPNLPVTITVQDGQATVASKGQS